MKKIPLVSLIVFFLCIHAEGQIVNPMLWLRADSAEAGSPVWRDLSGNGYEAPFVSDSAVTADTLLNFNPGFRFDGSTTLLVPHLQSAVPANDVIIVYQTDTAVGAEMPLWGFRSDSTRPLGLTTRRIVNGGSTIQYSDTNERRTIVNSLSQLWHRNGTGDTLDFAGCVGGDDTARFHGLIAELVVLPCGEAFTDTSHVQWCSYLAVKYGVTLDEIPYLSSAGRVIWPPDSMAGSPRRVIGIGRDDHFGLYQRQSAIPDGMLAIGLGGIAAANALNAGTMEDGSFLMLGCAENTFSTATDLTLGNGQTVVRYGDVVVRVTGDDIPQKPTALRADASAWGDSLQEYVLLVDRSADGGYLPWNTEAFLPAAVDTVGRSIVFDGVQWDTDGSGQDVFCFARLTGEALSYLSGELVGGLQARMLHNGGQSGDKGWYTLYPNPNDGHFVIEAAYPESTPLTVNFYSADGKLVRSYRCAEAAFHRLEGSLSGKGQYFIEMVSRWERNTVKMIVQ